MSRSDPPDGFLDVHMNVGVVDTVTIELQKGLDEVEQVLDTCVHAGMRGAR